MKKSLLFVALALCFVSALPASAQLWGVPGSVGIIDESSTSLYEFSGSSLKFKSGQTGTIVARYPIYSPVSQDPMWTRIAVAYAGPGVTVRLVQIPRCLRYENTIATQAFTGTDNDSCDPLNISHTWDFWNYSYYVEATLTRSTTSANPQLHHLWLE
jgi:hypothetical protein